MTGRWRAALRGASAGLLAISAMSAPVLAQSDSTPHTISSFPRSIALSSTWDTDLVRQVNDHIAGEVRARGVHQVLSPVVDVARDPRPRSARMSETTRAVQP